MKKNNEVSIITLVALVSLIVMGPGVTYAAGPAAVDLLSISTNNFVILSKTGVTNTGSHTSAITGNVGSSPITAAAMDNVFCSEITGTIYGVDAAYTGSGTTTCFAGNPPLANKTLVDNAVLDMGTAYTDAAGRTTPDGTELYAGNLGGQTFAPGLYKWSTDVTIPTNVTLSGGANDVWIFQIAGNLSIASAGDIASGIKVVLSGGAQASNVFWQVGGATGATLGTYSTFNGIILSAKQVIIQTGAVLNGRALADTQVTLDANPVSAPVSVGTLHIIKQVINDNGGTAIASAFTISVTGTNVSNPSFAGSAEGVDVTLDAGSYTVTEPIVPTGYLQTGSGDCSGTIAAGQTKTCTITNDDIAPQLIVNKIVINDNGRTKVIADFPLFVDGVSVTSGVTTTTTIGLHTVSETVDSNYTATIGGHCAANGTITLALGDIKSCPITNNDTSLGGGGGGGGGGSSYSPTSSVSPFIDVITVPSPLALPAGSGLVTYTYTTYNRGTVPITNVTMVGDTCSPIVLNSGDTNGDLKLDTNETWIYKCSITLAKTRTNTVTVTGQANGIGVVDVASSTVIVGLPITPPLIHVTKIPSPLTLSTGGGMITYTNKVTNPGTVALSNVLLADDKCGPLKYISGDANNNLKLDTTETWTYTCQMNLTKTMTNTVTVSGEANGLTARDVAFATVVVAPSDPNTLPPASSFGQQVRAIAISLRWGSLGSDVSILQQFLISQNKGPSAQALARVGATAYFGNLTRAALAEFQAKVGVNPPLGNFGPITRAYLRANY